MPDAESKLFCMNGAIYSAWIPPLMVFGTAAGLTKLTEHDSDICALCLVLAICT